MSHITAAALHREGKLVALLSAVGVSQALFVRARIEMECSCSCSFDDDCEPVNCHNSKTRTARKTHQCEECLCIIRHGDRYVVDSFVFDGKWEEVKTCATCTRMRLEYRAPYRGMRVHLWECLGYDIVSGATYDDDDAQEQWEASTAEAKRAFEERGLK